MSIASGLNQNKYVNGLFSDIRKAYDSVDHNIMLRKLHNIGIRGMVLLWVSNYLCRRKQFVSINGELSNTSEITCSVPQ